MKIIDGVYAYIWTDMFENNCNMFYFSDPLNILFDPGLNNHLDERFGMMKKDGLDPDAIRCVVNTHCHPDHFEGSITLAKKNIGIAMHKDEIAFLNEQGPAFFHMFGLPFPDITFGQVLKDGVHRFGDTDLHILHTPGHSPGSICIYWPEKKTLVCGDLVFEESFGRVDFPGGDGVKLIESIKKIAGLDIEILLPGHMNYIQGKSNIQNNFKVIENYFNRI